MHRTPPLPALLGGFALLSLLSPATAHDAVTGWSYPLECCAQKDCKAVPETAVSERKEGYVVEYTGERLKYSDSRIRLSPDGVYHWCAAGGLRTICLFVPPRLF